MDYLGKGEILTNRDVNKFVHNILEKYIFCLYRTSLVSFILTHETWDQHFTCCGNIFVQYSIITEIQDVRYTSDTLLVFWWRDLRDDRLCYFNAGIKGSGLMDRSVRMS